MNCYFSARKYGFNSSCSKSLFLGGQHEPEWGGHFTPEWGGQLRPELHGHFDRNLHFNLSRSVRKGFSPVLKAFFRKKILLMILTSYLWIAGTVYLLYLSNLWNQSMWKDTIIWSVFTSFIMLMKFGGNNKKRLSLKDVLIESVKLVAILEFIVNIYSTAFWLELIIVPVLILLTLLLAVSETNSEYAKVSKLLNGVISLFGLGILIYSVYKIKIHFDEVATVQTGLDYLLPILLTALFVPFIFLLNLLMRKEQERVMKGYH